jgi:hypothetical protein
VIRDKYNRDLTELFHAVLPELPEPLDKPVSDGCPSSSTAQSGTVRAIGLETGRVAAPTFDWW